MPPGHHLRLNHSSKSECGEECKCPNWVGQSGGCSFFEGMSILNSTIYNSQTKEKLQPLMPKFCAIGEQSPSCDKKPKKLNIIRIQLYDETNLMLNQVNIDYQLSSEPV